MKKSQDYTGRYLPNHNTEPHRRDRIKCFYCGSKVDEWVEHRGIRMCLVCAEDSENIAKLEEEMTE